MIIVRFLAKGLIMKRAIVAIAVVSAALGGGAYAKTIYVDANAAGVNTGTCWADAYRFLQDALTDANSSEKPVEIRVAQGVYQPDRSAAEPNGMSDWNWMATFRLINGVTIQGGYAGLGHQDPNARDIELYETILSGDLKGNDASVSNPDPEAILREVTRGDNSWRVVEAWDTDGSAGLDGFTVTAGNNPAVCKYGPCAGAGGLRNMRASPTIERCTFTANAAGAGGGICNYEESSPSIVNCLFTENYARSAGAIYGGNAIVESCSFLGNRAWWAGAMGDCEASVLQSKFIGNSAEYGGAVAGCRGIIVDTIFSSNSANEDGGAMFAGCSATLNLKNCILSRNSAADLGGAIRIACDAVVTITNCTLTGNSATNGNAVACYHPSLIGAPSDLAVSNCILFDGGDEIWTNYDSIIMVTHSDIEGGYAGEGNIDADPCFADVANNDYHLKSQAGRWDPNDELWTMDDVTSPCIDAGDPMSPIGLEPFPNSGLINMGAYGGTAEASKSYFGEAPCEVIVAGDVNGDCVVDFLDFGIMGVHWLEEH
ncbi:MAG: hypothetical protein JXN61_08375 [Sedimentisphaerales bacterium]|nr:hypothetical protein [Sedimentisphaerales bacterium]